MDVLITFGRYAGQIRDIAPDAALAMLKDGRAKRPGEELPVPTEVESRTFAPAEIAVAPALRPEEVVELASSRSRRRSRR
jgi:hypothetical protein